jgi:hypothetical protein
VRLVGLSVCSLILGECVGTLVGVEVGLFVVGYWVSMAEGGDVGEIEVLGLVVGELVGVVVGGTVE